MSLRDCAQAGPARRSASSREALSTPSETRSEPGACRNKGLNLFFPRFYHFFPSTLPFFPSTLLSPTLRTFNVFFHPELLAIRNASEGPDFARSRRSMLERLAPSPFLEAALPRTPCAFAGRHRGRGRPPTQTNTKTQTRTTQYNRSAGAKNRCTAGLQEYRN